MKRIKTRLKTSLARATKHIDTSLNFIGGRLGLDHDQVFFGRFGVPVMARYLDQRESKKLGPISAKERDKLLFWYVQAAMWGRFSGSTESFIDQDLAALEGDDGGLDKLLEQLRLWHGGLRAEPGHFHRLEPWSTILPCAVSTDAHGGSPRLGDWCPAQGRHARQDESIRSPSHLSEVSTLQAKLQAPGS